MHIAELPVHDEALFNEFALSYGTIFNSVEWTNLFDGRARRFGIYSNGNTLIGGFITHTENKYGLSVYRNPPFTPMIGPFLKLDAKNPVSVLDMWKGVMAEMADFMNDLPYSILSFSLNSNLVDMQPFIWKQFKVIPGYTYIIDLKIPVENIWRRMSTGRRNDIAKGEKDGLRVARTTDHGQIRSLMSKTFRRQNITVNEIYLDKILFQFANTGNSFAFITYNSKDRPIACSFIIYDRNTAYYLLGGYDNEHKHHGAGALSLWESIKYAQQIGLTSFDFEGSMVPQIERYFRGFGGQLVPYYGINKAKLPLEIILKFFKRHLF